MDSKEDSYKINTCKILNILYYLYNERLLCRQGLLLYNSQGLLREAQYSSKGCAMIQMSQKQKQEKSYHQEEKEKKRQERLAQQLRQNLKRRKEQSRQRAQKES